MSFKAHTLYVILIYTLLYYMNFKTRPKRYHTTRIITPKQGY